MCPFISSITTSDMPIHIPSKYHHFILRDTTYQMKYLIPKTLNNMDEYSILRVRLWVIWIVRF